MTWRHYLMGMEECPLEYVPQGAGPDTIQVISPGQKCRALSEGLAPIDSRVLSTTGGKNQWVNSSLKVPCSLQLNEKIPTHLWIFFSCFSCAGFQSLIGGSVMGARMIGYPLLKPPSNGGSSGPSRQIFPSGKALFSGASLVSALNLRTFSLTVHAMERASHQVLPLFRNTDSGKIQVYNVLVLILISQSLVYFQYAMRNETGSMCFVHLAELLEQGCIVFKFVGWIWNQV